MDISFERAKAAPAQANTNVGRETTSYRTPQGPERTASGGFALDISGTVMDNSAYAGHGRTAEEVMLEAGQEDITARRNYMAVMSNSMSDEDFAKLQEEGFHPGSTDIETVVTIVDHIKAALLKGGTQVAGYTDSVRDDVLEEITGSQAFAQELKKQFAQRDIPLTQENIDAVTNAWNMLSGTDSMTEGSMKYMVENDLDPTPENIYTARYSALSDGSRQGKGYYAAGSVAGYYAKKPEEIDFEKLRPQMERVIEEAGYQVDEQSLSDAGWLVEKGIPLNTDTFSLLRDIKEQKFPVSYERFVAAAACALADGISPEKAALDKSQTFIEQAEQLVEQVNAIDEAAVDHIVARELPLTLRNILAAQEQLRGGYKGNAETGQEGEILRGRRLLEEVRLSMTTEANLRLLRSGYQIDTAPLEELVFRLKEAESSYEKALTGQVGSEAAQEKASLYRETLTTLEGIQSSPAVIVSQISVEDTLKEVYANGADRRLVYEKAGQSYEALMTAPRRDMGDSIQKAFRNVDDILSDMNMELSDENRRAVRILGYNSLEITEDNILAVKEKDGLLCGVIREMKPGRVLNMIRDGVNPLNMPLDELQQYLSQQDTADEMESYSRFLYKLEKQKGISEEERSAYIGIYRLVHQVEKADDAAVGALWQSGVQFTLGNLLSSVRSSRHGRMDYSVDEFFGGVGARGTGVESITDQIEKAFASGRPPARQELEQILNAAGSQEAGEEFDRITYEQMRGAARSEEAVLRHLSDYQQPFTAENLLFAGSLLKTPGQIWNQVKQSREKGDKELEKAGEQVLKALEGKEAAEEAYEGFQKSVQNLLEEAAFSGSRTALDIRSMSILYRQMSFMGNMAREENYEIPIDLGGRLTSVNLKLIHNSREEESKVTVTFESEAFGKTAAEFKLIDGKLSGLCVCTGDEGSRILKESGQLLENKLKEEQIQPGQIYFAKSDKLDLAEYSLKETKDRHTGAGTQTLYRAARAFIGFVQETGIKKGSAAYENQL